MADDQADFSAFMAPADDAAAFAAPPAGGEESQIGDVYYGTTAPDEQTGDFFAAPPVEDAAPVGDAPIILGEPAPYDAPPPAGVEAVSDDEDEAGAAEDALGAVALTSSSSEPTPMSKWNDEWQTTLLARKDEENALKGTMVEKAREEIAAFQAEREKRREARMAKNRSDEQDKLEAIEADLENDNSWQRVVKMIELNQDSGEGAADTGRMKDVLVLLKNEPGRADALSA